MPPKWSPCRCVTAIASIVAGSTCFLIAGRADPPQSSSSDTPGAVTWMAAFARPPSLKAFPLPRNWTRTVTRSRIQADRDGVLRAVDLDANVVSGLVVSRGLEQTDRPGAQLQNGARCGDVAVLRV